jgi:hypothetical protein
MPTLSAAGGSSTFGISGGVAPDTVTGFAIQLASPYTKTASAWAVGSGNGSLDTGTIANNTWYHVHLIRRPDTGVVDILTSLSATAPTMPANYTQSRRLGGMFTDGSAQWRKFSQDGDEFLLDVPILSDNTPLSTASQTFGLSVPTGVKVVGIFNFLAGNSGSAIAGVYSSGDTAAQAVNTPAGNYSFSSSSAAIAAVGNLRMRTNTSGQIRGIANGASTTHQLVTVGWVDRRGRA